MPLRWRHNGLDSVSNHQPPGCLLNRLFKRKSKKTSKLRVTGLCAGNSPGTGEFSAQMASYAENVSIWWRHHAIMNLMRAYEISFGVQCQTLFLSAAKLCVSFILHMLYHCAVPRYHVLPWVTSVLTASDYAITACLVRCRHPLTTRSQ